MTCFNGRMNGKFTEMKNKALSLMPNNAKLSCRYLRDKYKTVVGIEVSDGEGFTAYMSEELFNRLGLNETAKMKG